MALLADNESATINDETVDFFEKYDIGGGHLLRFAIVCIILFIVFGICGNALTMVALLRCPRIRKCTTSAFIISLCIADAIFCSINLPLTASRFIHKEWVHGQALCVIFPFVRYSNVAVSLLSIVAISINRYILIAHPSLHNRIFQRKYIVMMIASCWIFSFSMLIPTLFGSWGRFDYDPSIGNCSIVPVDGRSAKKYLFVGAFVIPCLVIVLSYAGIFWRVRGSNLRMLKHSSATKDKQKEKKRKREEWRITCMVLVIFISFVICYLPITIMKVTGFDKSHPELHILGYLLIYMSACINPVIYVIMNKQYRQAYKTILFCRHPRASSIGSNRLKNGRTSSQNDSYSVTKNTYISTANSHADGEDKV